MNVESLVGTLRADVVSGAAVIAVRASELAERVAREAPAQGVDDLRAVLVRYFEATINAQPSMAPLVALAAAVLAGVETSPDLEAARAGVADDATAFRDRLARASDEVARAARVVIEPPTRVITISDSSTVSAALVAAAADGEVGVICLEGRPGMEGRRLASRLSRAGISVTVAVDAAAHALAAESDLAVIGADSIGDAGAVNKIGSRALARAAADARVPFYVLADTTKLLPPNFGQHTDDDRPADEVLPSSLGAGVDVWNRYFEPVPLDAVTGVITERGLMAPGDVESLRASSTVPPELRGLR